MTARNRNSIPTNTSTRYEVALMRGSEIIHVYGYTARKSKFGILNAISGQDVLEFLTEPELAETETMELTYSAKYGFKVATNVYVRFTGNTERQVAA